MFASLRSRLTLTNLAVTLVALLVLTVVFTQLLRQHSIDVAQSGVSASATQLRRDVNRELVLIQQLSRKHRTSAPKPALLWNYLLHDSQVLGRRIIFFSASGGCGFDSRYYRNLIGHARTACTTGTYDQWLLRPVSADRSLSGFVKEAGKTYLLTQRATRSIFFPRIPQTAHEHGAVVLVTDASSVIPTWSTVAPVFLLAAVAAAIVFLLMATYFAYAVSRPLARLTEAAGSMAHGDYTARVNIPGGGEIGELGRTFNHMATQVAASHQLLKDFVANVSHDLRTPLTIISGFAGSLLDGTTTDEAEAQEAAAVISSEAGRMERLVDDLLQLTRLESGLRKFEQRPVFVQALVDETIRRATAASTRERPVVNRVPATIPTALGDQELVERALLNLLNNALEHTPPDATIEVTARVNGSWIEIAVSDTGPGIPAEAQTRVFERLYRMDKSRGRDSGHSGLGLPIVREIVEAHGGAVQLESTPGRGSTFRFTIPRADAQAHA